MELPKPHRQRLLRTSEERVPQELATALAEFCAGRPEVQRAFVCAVENTVPGEEPTERLSFAVDLTWPVSEPEDSRGMSRTLVTAMLNHDPQLMRELGLAVLADRAVPAWERHGRQVYALNDEGRP